MKDKQLLKACGSAIKAMQKAVKETDEFSKNMKAMEKLSDALIEGSKAGGKLRKMTINNKGERCSGFPFTFDWIIGSEKIDYEKLNYKKENEMNKCEWKNGKFTPCSKFDPLKIVSWQVSGLRVTNFSCCGLEIKEEPEQPIIKKSGGTWVARFEGVDYISMRIDLDKCKGKFDNFTNNFLHEISIGTWKPISEIEITDEIALLRPMVKQLSFCPPHPEGTIRKLWGIGGRYCLTTTNDHFNQLAIIVDNLSLATVKDLED